MSKSMQRYLDKTEYSLNKAPTWILEYEGCFQYDKLRKAIELLAIRYPIVCASIVRQRGSYLLRVNEHDRADLVVLHGGREALLQHISSKWDVTEGVVKFFLAQDGLHGHLGVRVDNSVFDGTGFEGIVSNLLSFYADIIAGRKLNIDPGELPPAPYEHLVDRWLRGEHVESSSLLKSVPDHVLGGESITLEGFVSREAVQRLKSVSRSYNTTVHSLICGAAVVGLRKLASIPAQAETEMACWSMVDLRRRVDPPVGQMEVMKFQGMHRSRVSISANSDAISVGCNIKDQLESALALRRVRLPMNYVETYEKQPLNTELSQARANICVSNFGVRAQLPQPPNIRIVNSWVRQHPRTAGTLPVLGTFGHGDGAFFVLSASDEVFKKSELENLLSYILTLVNDINKLDGERVGAYRVAGLPEL